MELRTRRIIDRYFTSLGMVSILLMAAALAVLLGPIIWKGAGAYVFQGTVEFRRMILSEFERGDSKAIEAEIAESRKALQPIYDALATYEAEVETLSGAEKREAKKSFRELQGALREWLGPLPGDSMPALPRGQYGQTRWDRAQIKLDRVLMIESYDNTDPSKMGVKVKHPRVDDFKGTAAEPIFTYAAEHAREILRPRLTFYSGFLTDASMDAHIFGGIWPEVLGTLYLTLGAMLFAVPMGVIAAIYLVEYAKESLALGFLRTCISTLAGVPSIVFGLFGLAFFINTIHVSPSKSVLAGSMTLALLVLPTVIRASEEAIRAVPNAFREAAMSLGATKWRSIVTVVLPAALPGILTSIVISMGRAAGETAPIIFTAAVSVGMAISPSRLMNSATPALPWNIYNLCTEHEAVDEIRHVQFGMVFTLVALVVVLNLTAIILRAKITRKLKG